MEEALGFSKVTYTLTDSSRQWRLTFSVTFEWGLFICTWRSSRWKKFTLSWKVSEPPENSDNFGQAWAVNTSNMQKAFLRLTAQVSLAAQGWVYCSKVWRQNSRGSLQLVLLTFRYSQVHFQSAWQKSQTEKEQLAWWNTFTGSTNRNRRWDSRNQSSHQRSFSAGNLHSPGKL